MDFDIYVITDSDDVFMSALTLANPHDFKLNDLHKKSQTKKQIIDCLTWKMMDVTNIKFNPLNDIFKVHSTNNNSGWNEVLEDSNEFIKSFEEHYLKYGKNIQYIESIKT